MPRPTTETTVTSPPSTAPIQATTGPEPDADLKADLESLVTASLAENEGDRPVPATGAVVGVRRPGTPDILLAVGVDGFDGAAPRDATAPFYASAISARFTTTAAMRMIDEGLLDPGATLDTWVPEFPSAELITVEMLLDATSGMGEIDNRLDELLVPDLTGIWTPREVLAESATDGLIGTPGTFDTVTNGPGLGAANVALGLIIEEVTGSSLADAIATYVIEPLGLSGTAMNNGGPRPDDVQDGIFDLPDAAGGFTPVSMRSVPNEGYFSYGRAMWGVTTTLTDLLDFTEAVATGKLLGAETTQRALDFDPGRNAGRNFYVGRGMINGYCLCDDITPPLEVRGIGFAGGAIGSSAFALYLPASGITITYQANADGATPASLRRAIYDLVTSQ